MGQGHQAHLVVHKGQQLGQCPVESQQVILGLQARRPEDVAYIVGGRETDTQVVGGVVLAQSFIMDQCFGKV